jgi:hypothetical protein
LRHIRGRERNAGYRTGFRGALARHHTWTNQPDVSQIGQPGGLPSAFLVRYRPVYFAPGWTLFTIEHVSSP